MEAVWRIGADDREAFVLGGTREDAPTGKLRKPLSHRERLLHAPARATPWSFCRRGRHLPPAQIAAAAHEREVRG
jgi:hypothetical protein